jgi:hypothetical protein
MHGYNQTDQSVYKRKLQEAIEEIGLTQHIVSSRGLRAINRDVFYDCTRCGALVSLLDVHIATCPQIPVHLRTDIQLNIQGARICILTELAEQKESLSSSELEHLKQCVQGPHMGRLELIEACSVNGVDAYCYSVAEEQLVEERRIASFTVSAYPEHDLQIMLVVPATVTSS